MSTDCVLCMDLFFAHSAFVAIFLNTVLSLHYYLQAYLHDGGNTGASGDRAGSRGLVANSRNGVGNCGTSQQQSGNDLESDGLEGNPHENSETIG